jgi:hypothetical protein
MTDLTTQILIEIRDEIRATNQRLDQVASGLNSRIDKTNTRLDESNTRLDRLERRQVEAEARVSTALVDVVGAVHEMRDAFLVDRQLRETVANHEQRLQVLERPRG